MKTFCTFIIMCTLILLRMRNISEKCCGENQAILLYSVNFPPENFSVYEIMWNKMVEPNKPQMTASFRMMDE